MATVILLICSGGQVTVDGARTLSLSLNVFTLQNGGKT